MKGQLRLRRGTLRDLTRGLADEMAAHSAGLLMYRRVGGRLEVLLVHPGGPFWSGRDVGAWTIPKGEVTPPEAPLETARRELREETGCAAEGEVMALHPIRQRGGKEVHAWAVEGDCDPSQFRSNTFSMEWPPRSGRQAEFPEVDRAAWFPLSEARQKMNPAQTALLDELEVLIGEKGRGKREE